MVRDFDREDARSTEPDRRLEETGTDTSVETTRVGDLVDVRTCRLTNGR